MVVGVGVTVHDDGGGVCVFVQWQTDRGIVWAVSHSHTRTDTYVC